MTYRELGQARGISAASAARLAFRKGWQRQPGNDGAARVAVPIGEDQPRGSVGGWHHASQPARAAESALAQAIEALRGEISEAHARADRADADRRTAEQRAEGEVRRADALRDQLALLEAEVAAAQADADQARAQAADAAAWAADALRRADAAARAGWLARVLAAWRGR